MTEPPAEYEIGIEDTDFGDDDLPMQAEPDESQQDGAEPVDFLAVATALVKRDFSVIPIKSGRKYPPLTPNGTKNRTKNPDLIANWAARFPNANVALCADENFVILESDDEATFRKHIKELTGEELPPTLTSGATANRPHFIFRRGAVPSGVNLSAQGLFELRAHNEYVMGPGSIHPAGRRYQLREDRDPAVFPKWLFDALKTMHAAKQGERNAASAFIAPSGATQIKSLVLEAPYFGDYNALIADESVDISIPRSERHETLVSLAGALYSWQTVWRADEDGGLVADEVARDEDEIFDLLCRIRHRFCEVPDEKDDEELLRMVRHAMKGTPCKEPEPNVPSWVDFPRVFATQEAFDNRPNPSPESQLPTVDWFFDGDSFLLEELPPRLVLAEELNGTPVFYAKSLNQIFAFRGLGKTMFVHGLVDILINGGEFLRYKSNGGMRVLLADGELPDVQLQDRVRRQIGDSSRLLKLISPERLPGNTFPNLSERKWQVEFLKRIGMWTPDVIVFDTLSGSFKFDTNDADTWREVNGFLIELRILGLCVILVHHAGKAGTQRGRTDGDDNLDLSIKLEAPKGWAAGDGLEVAVSYERCGQGDDLVNSARHTVETSGS